MAVVKVFTSLDLYLIYISACLKLVFYLVFCIF